MPQPSWPDMDVPPIISPSAQKTSRGPFCLALGANVANLLLSVPFYFVPSGTPVRAMGWSSWVFTIGIGGFIALLLVLPLARRRQWSVLLWSTFLLAVTPIPLAVAMLHHAAHVKGFILEP